MVDVQGGGDEEEEQDDEEDEEDEDELELLCAVYWVKLDNCADCQALWCSGMCRLSICIVTQGRRRTVHQCHRADAAGLDCLVG